MTGKEERKERKDLTKNDRGYIMDSRKVEQQKHKHKKK